MNETKENVRGGVDEHKDIADTLDSLHVRLDNIQGALECVAMAAYHIPMDGLICKDPNPQQVCRALDLIVADIGAIVKELCDLEWQAEKNNWH
jgi:hypothetical protein